MMFLRSVCLSAVLLAIPFNMSLAADEAASKDGFVVASNSVIPQIANGGGRFFMAFQLMNVTGAPATVTISFLDGQGDPMAIPFVQDGAQVTAATLSETIAPRGIEFAATQSVAATVQIGYARIQSEPANSVAVSTTFNQIVSGGPLFQAFIPLDNALQNQFFVPFINTGGFTGSMAIVSLAGQDVSIIARNNNGVELCRSEQTFAAGQHRSFLMRDELPCTVGVNGVVEVSAGDIGLSGGGLTAEDSGAFVTQPVFAAALLL